MEENVWVIKSLKLNNSMAKLAIKGHSTRGKEVIEILERLGGKISHECGYKDGFDPHYVYFIDTNENFFIDGFLLGDKYSTDFSTFTLEVFLEKFPYKVGDKVITIYGKNGVVSRNIWSERDNCVRYELEADVDSFYFVNELQPYKEQEPMSIPETMKQITDIAENLIKIDIPKGYEFAGVDNDNQQVVFEKIGCQYPKTYEECCDVLKIEYPYFKTEEDGISASTYKNKLFGDLKQLLICRDAYWKLAGEQMGLGKPWKPSKNDNVYCIFRLKGEIVKDNFVFGDSLMLEFPTEEMRDSFLESEEFAQLIGGCKEFL